MQMKAKYLYRVLQKNQINTCSSSRLTIWFNKHFSGSSITLVAPCRSRRLLEPLFEDNLDFLLNKPDG